MPKLVIQLCECGPPTLNLSFPWRSVGFFMDLCLREENVSGTLCRGFWTSFPIVPLRVRTCEWHCYWCPRSCSHLCSLTLIVFTFPFSDSTGTHNMCDSTMHPMLPILLTLWQDWIVWLILSWGIKRMKFKQMMKSMRLHRSYYRVQSFVLHCYAYFA